MDLIDLDDAIKDRIVDAENNPTRRQDYQTVRRFLALKGRPSRPIDKDIVLRTPEDFAAARRLLPADFFGPFNRLLRQLNRAEIEVERRMEAMTVWNTAEFVPRVVTEVCERLDRGDNPLLVPCLVWLFRNLERESHPSDWQTISAITVPGSRTYDRAAEAFRAYLKSRGQAWIITSGRAPYYDPNTESIQITEAEANAAYLRMLGVPSERIVVETSSRDTAENVEFLEDALYQIEAARGRRPKAIVLVTSPFHIARYRFNVDLMLRGLNYEIYAVGTKASRYWAETYFMVDPKSGYSREATIAVVFNEYLKIAFDLCVSNRVGSKMSAERGPS